MRTIHIALMASLVLAFSSFDLPAQQGNAQKSVPEKSQRGNTRIFYWGGNKSIGQLNIDYGQPVWKDSYQEQVDSGKLDNRRWRLGQNAWTALDTNIPLTIGGQKLEVGLYYMTLERNSDGEFWLYFLDPKEIRKRKLDAFHAHMSKGGKEVLMEEDEMGESTKLLEIELVTSGKQDRRANIEIRYGPYRLKAPVVMHPEES